MTNNCLGTIVEESLENKDVLNDVKIIKTRVSEVTAEDKTHWLKQWTLHTVEIPESQATELAQKLRITSSTFRIT